LLRWLKRRPADRRLAGVDLYDDGCAFAVVDRGSATPCVVAARWCDFSTADVPGHLLGDAVRDARARGLPVHAVMRHSSYSLVQLEAPDLPDEDLAEAMRWRVSDLVDFPIEDAIVDVFRLPASRRPGAPPLVYVVVARAADVEALVDLMAQAGLEVESVDIVEMAIRNLALYVDRPGRPRAYLHLQPGQTVIEIADGPQVYLGRRVLQDYDATADPIVLQAQMESLALEIQRSLDYFESQYALGAADRLSILATDPAAAAAFGEVASHFLTVRTQPFDLGRVELAPGVELDRLGRGVTAVGAAMRGLPWAA
jgi:MSHA biogenesis protein MshI